MTVPLMCVSRARSIQGSEDRFRRTASATRSALRSPCHGSQEAGPGREPGASAPTVIGDYDSTQVQLAGETVRLNKLSKKLDDFIQNFNTWSANVNAQLKNIDTKFGSRSSRLDSLEKKVSDLEANIPKPYTGRKMFSYATDYQVFRSFNEVKTFFDLDRQST